MPRRARRDDVTSVANEDAAQSNASLANDSISDQSGSLTTGDSLQNQPELSSSDPSAEQAAPKPRSTRQRRPARSKAEPISTDDADKPADDQPVSAPEISGAGRSRGGRRTRAVAASASSSGQAEQGSPEADEAINIAAQMQSDGSLVSDPVASPRRRQVGGRRTPNQSVEATSADIESSDSSDTHAEGLAADSGARSSRRNRRGGSRRRRNQNASVDEQIVDQVSDPLEVAEEIAVEDNSQDATEDVVAGESAETTRSRRSRRGGRRRSKGEAAIDPETGEQIVVATATEAVDDLALPTPHIRERYSMPGLVPSVSGLDSQSIDLGVSASIDSKIPAFVINGQQYTPHLCFVNAESPEGTDNAEMLARQIERAAAAGVHLHTAVTYLPLKNAYGERSMEALDGAIRAVVAADPDAFIALRVQCAPTNFWVRTHPDQMVRYQDGSEGDVTIASSEFWADCVDAISALLQHLAHPDCPGFGRVFALHLDKGEWFYEPGAGFDYSASNRIAYQNWLHECYQAPYALRSSWLDNRVTFETAEIPKWESNPDKRDDSVLYDRKADRKNVDYALYSSSVVGNVICGLATAVKELTGGKILVFVPYGYIFEFATRNDSGHNALGQVLACPDVDVLTGPNSYSSRAAGGVGGFAAPVDSVLLHNKIWLVEDDTKTYLAPDDTPDTYNPKIPTPQETVMVHRRNFFAALAHGCGLTWMDLWGQGWLDADTIWEEFHDMIAAAQRFQSASGQTNHAPEAAVIVDEASYAFVRNDSGGHQLQSGAIIKARDLLLRTGASVGFYLQSDVDKLPESVKIVIFLNALRVTTEERRAIRERLQRPGLTLAWLYAPGLFDENGVAPSEVTEIVGMAIKPQQWNSRVGTIFTEERHVVIERLHGGKRMGTTDVINPSYTVVDPQAVVLGEYAQSGNPSIVSKAVDGGWRSIFIGEPHLTGELIRGMFRYSGVHIYDVQDDIVYTRGDGSLLIHAPYSGQRVIYLPRPAACYSLFEGRLITQNSSSVRVFMRGRSTHLLLWGDLESIAACAGKSVEQLLETLNTRNDRDQDRPGDSSEGYVDDEGRPQQKPRGGQGDLSRYESDVDGEYDQSGSSSELLGQVLKAVVEEVYVESVGNVDSAEAALLDAKREAARITEELLSDITISAETVMIDMDIDSMDSESAVGQGEAGSETGESGARRRSSSRRRKWRRRQSAAGAAEGSAPVSVDDMIGDLVAKHHKAGESDAGGPRPDS